MPVVAEPTGISSVPGEPPAWLHVTVRDRAGALVFESGGITPAGLICGNDNDEDPASVEPHH